MRNKLNLRLLLIPLVSSNFIYVPIVKKSLMIAKGYIVIRIRKSKDRQHNGQRKDEDKRINNDL